MITPPSLGIAARSMRAHPLRTLLSTLGMSIGVASLVAVLSLGDGLEATMREMARADGRMQTITVASVTADVIDGVRVARATPPSLAPSDARALAQSIRDAVGDRFSLALIARGVTRITETGSRRVRAIPIVGVDVPVDGAGTFTLGAGTMPDSAAHLPYLSALVSDSLAILLGGSGTRLPVRSLVASADTLRIVGVLARSRRNDRSPLLVVIPLGRMARVAGPAAAGPLPIVDIRALRIEEVAAIRSSAERWVARRFGAGWRDSASVQSYEREAAQGARAVRMFKLFMGAITGISLIVGGIGVMNVLLVAVAERTREIGIRRAVGARRRDIVRQFLTESILIAAVGAFAGAVVGAAGAWLATIVMRQLEMGEVTPSFSPGSIAVVCAAVVAVGLVFGTYPALHAGRLSPIDALRNE